MPDRDLPPEVPVPAGLGSQALRNTILVLTAKIASRLVALVTVFLTLKYLTAAPYGTFTTLINYTAIISVVLDLGFNVLYVREGARDKASIQRYLRNVMSLRALMAVVAFVILAGALGVAGLGGLLVPGFALKTVLGEFAEEGLLGGQRAIPAALEAAGYEFRHNTVGEALAYVTSTVES